MRCGRYGLRGGQQVVYVVSFLPFCCSVVASPLLIALSTYLAKRALWTSARWPLVAPISVPASDHWPQHDLAGGKASNAPERIPKAIALTLFPKNSIVLS